MQRQSLADVVHAAQHGEQDAWDEIVRRFEGLLWSTARGFRLSSPAAADVVQTTWLRLVEHLGEIRDPDRLGAWLGTTIRHECLRALRVAGRDVLTDEDAPFERGREDEPPVDAALLADDRDRQLWAAFGSLNAGCQQLLRLLSQDPPVAYDAIAEALGRPVGSIGPTRARCLEQLGRAMVGAGFER
ncbi:MAG: sigma-70 family RNA polymerase sigma factor [Thermoleophilia bacterium]